MILPGQTIGILGGGQLGRMMALSAREMGLRVAVLEPAADSPCGQVSDHEVITAYDDQDGIKELAEKSDVITYEFENVDVQSAAWLETNANLPQGSRLLQVTQHRLREKETLMAAGVPVAPFKAVHDAESLREAAAYTGLPAVLKTCRGGYDGKGQVVILTNQDFSIAEELLKYGNDFVLEAWIPFEKELSVIITRSVNGETTTFPLAENIHVNNILHQTIVPARVTAETEQKAKQLARSVAAELNLIGTLAVEMFAAADGTLYVNELAPRPHNSGHYTIEACATSQFDQHIRAICGWPLGSTELLKPAVMINVLGEHIESILNNLSELKEAKLHLYGKDEAKTKRKMGHITVLGDSTEKVLTEADRIIQAVYPQNLTEVIR
ncbi:5-(carboxyamino)imidazole ribonucleotide synthase [Fictibacillus aquaticus]|uniref:N5-carboxyaminoimidazole ribonucleotide synthase n=1 Tax=Fictibacillus aquaticus TaxID=2021314 RepID=A0A235F6G6_9BACL|nr:5-(carboxyamino)imidazole ribonucleotide synthase [Fictibacillus aquaticus]OYD56798.1 5-(carboxyamino)imidazole ribonucleotide synthase [Fictibacillus aquaticus]